MSRRSIIIGVVLLFFACFACFGQTSPAALRDYVGMISQGFHPDVITFLQKHKSRLEKEGYSSMAKALENFIKGDSGTGFVYVGSDGKNYIITNYHVISQAHTLSITFETPAGEKTKFADLSIIAVDEDMDIALLSLGGQNFFKQGLTLLNRPVNEGETVFSAGFPGAGSAMIWQFGQGIVSNASVRLPPEDENDKAIGPYIQHTAQVDAGNSGGPLLIQEQVRGVTSYSVAGINTLSIRRRQAANYSIPAARVKAFIDASLKPPAADQRPILEERVNAFIKGLSVPKAVYPHIAQFLSNSCTGENFEYAINELSEKASKTVRNDIYDRDIISSLTCSVAWTIENSLRSKTGAISVKLNSITPSTNGMYTVSFDVNGSNVDSEWINEYGIWRIRKFGTSASGDKTRIDKKKQDKEASERLHDNPSIMISAGLAYPFDLGPAFGAELIAKMSKYSSIEIKGYFGGKEYTQVEVGSGLYIPITMGSVALTPFIGVGAGMMFVPNPYYKPNSSSGSLFETLMPMGISARAGFSFTTAAVPGLFLQASYQYNLYFNLGGGDDIFSHPQLMYVGLGYAW
jgi:serine protease Do